MRNSRLNERTVNQQKNLLASTDRVPLFPRDRCVLLFGMLQNPAGPP